MQASQFTAVDGQETAYREVNTRSKIALILFSLNLPLLLKSFESLLELKSEINDDEDFWPLHIM